MSASTMVSPELFSSFAQVLTAGAAFLASITSLIAMFISARNGRKIEEVKQATNGMRKELVKTVGEAEHARGYKQAVDEAADEAANGAKK